MERLALLWDELDDLVGAGAHLAGGAALALADSTLQLLRRPIRAAAPAEADSERR
ncbi:MAG TPA: hypothetical protein VMB48_08230 [Steroidobacteraceae bacterium]|nr:hypothetical protein [Steroidobacteraceae bacterium]